MQRVILDTTKTELTTAMFNSGAAIYVVKTDYNVNSMVLLPTGSELIIEEGSIKLSSYGTGSMPNGIYLLCGTQTSLSTYQYQSFCLTSGCINNGYEYDSQTRAFYIKYKPKLTKFLNAGDYIRHPSAVNIQMKLTSECRIMLPINTAMLTINIASNKVNNIQIDGKCYCYMQAENCKFERVFGSVDGWVLNSNTVNRMLFNRFENCEFTAEDFAGNRRTPFSNFFSLIVQATTVSGTDTKPLNRLDVKDCVFENVGLSGNIQADNCTFLFGSNLNLNGGTLQCEAQSRILNCYFDGRKDTANIPELTSPVINGQDAKNIIIYGCTFVSYKSLSSEEHDDNSIIVIKSIYNTEDPSTTSTDSVTKYLDLATGMAVRSCTFNLAAFTGSAIKLWADPAINNRHNPLLNSLCTTIENNYLDMPNAECFVNCRDFNGLVTINSNVGCVNNTLVLLGETVLQTVEDNDVTRGRFMSVKGNILRFQEYDTSALKDGSMSILKGYYDCNIDLVDNTVEGSLWDFNYSADIQNSRGVIRITDKELV